MWAGNHKWAKLEENWSTRISCPWKSWSTRRSCPWKSWSTCRSCPWISWSTCRSCPWKSWSKNWKVGAQVDPARGTVGARVDLARGKVGAKIAGPGFWTTWFCIFLVQFLHEPRQILPHMVARGKKSQTPCYGNQNFARLQMDKTQEGRNFKHLVVATWNFARLELTD